MPLTAHDWRADGNAHYDAERWSDAVQAFEHLLALEPGSVETLLKLGIAYQEQDLDLRAVECFEKAAALDPAHAKAWNNAGVSREKLGQDALAAEAYRNAVNSDSTLVQAVLNLAHLTLRLGDDEGAARLLEQAASLDPSNADTWDSLARVQLRLGRTAAANEAYRTAMEILSPHVLPHIKEAESALARGDYSAAEASLAGALKYLPDHPILRHMFAAVRGDSTERASGAYVSAMFDNFAETYDRHMRGNLEYRVPEQMAEVIVSMLQRAYPVQIIDLGCGTGFMGSALSHLKASIVGIDLSEKMLEQAAQRGVYARLVRGDLVEELDRIPAATADAVVAADVLIYLGNLQPVFAAAARALVPGGLFAVTVEALEEGNFKLKPTGRYVHSSRYLRELAAQSGFSEHRMQRIHVRRERENHVEGLLACFARQ